jgi:hypothetical protein
MQEEVDLFRRDPQHGLFLGSDQALFGHVHGNAHGRLGGALAIAGLQHPQLAFFDGELHILHVAVMLFQLWAISLELLVGRGHFGFQLGDVSWSCGCRPPRLRPGRWSGNRLRCIFSPVEPLRVMATPVALSAPCCRRPW